MVFALIDNQVEIYEENVGFINKTNYINQQPSLDSFQKLTEENLDMVIGELREYIHLFLFQGEISSFDNNIKNLFDLSQDDLNILKSVHFILSDEVWNLIKVLPQLLRNLSHSTSKEKEEFHGIVKGKIDWNDTLKTRYSKGFDDKSLFVCTPSSKVYDLEENQLLKFLLNEIIFLKENYIDFISFNDDDKNSETKYDVKKDWYEIVYKNYKYSKLALKKVYFDEISTIQLVKSKHVRRAFKNRNSLYHIVAKAFILFEKLFIDEDKDTLKEFVDKRVIRAADPNKMYELYAFVNLIKALPGNPELHLLRNRKSGESSLSVTSEDDNGIKITVYYQFTPKAFRDVSQYLEIVKHYTINASKRSPDLMIGFEKDGKTFYRIVEVKNTSNNNYIRTSIYKVMGYYKDFEDVEFVKGYDFTEDYPIVLLTWGGIKMKNGHNHFDDDILILNRTEFLENLNRLISIKT